MVNKCAYTPWDGRGATHSAVRQLGPVPTKLANPDSRQAIENELADVLFFLLRFAQRFDIDLDDALAAKMKLNAERYPVEKSRGKNLKYGDL